MNGETYNFRISLFELLQTSAMSFSHIKIPCANYSIGTLAFAFSIIALLFKYMNAYTVK